MKEFERGNDVAESQPSGHARPPMSHRIPPSDNGIVERLCGLVALTFDLPSDVLPLRPETRLYGAGLGLDSLDALRLVAALEEEFDITIDDTELSPSTFESIGSIVSLVRGKRVSGS